MTKSLPVSKQMVYNSYLRVLDKNGSAGIDKESIEEFNANLTGNLYKLWNRLSSGSYFPPPVRTVFIPKKQGGLRPLGIPTVSDRIAQGVVKDYLEPTLENIFHSSSFGYRPGRSAHDAVKQCQGNCINYAWVIDVDIKGFFDNINHEIMLGLLKKHTREKWILMYIERWLQAGVEQADGSIVSGSKGTPQGGVISPLLANVYLHHALDTWMDKLHSGNPFERYADDIVIHCASREEAEILLDQLHDRMRGYGLELHPEKTKIVYCKNYQRREDYENVSFDFLSYSFQPRRRMDKYGRSNKTFMVFSAAMSNKAKVNVRAAIKGLLIRRWATQPIEWFAEQLNPKIRGWINYYARFNKHEALHVFCYLNELLRKWLKNKYKLRSVKDVNMKYKAIQKVQPKLFYHWELGIRS
ncbi:MAG: group II intron reverse transcriptase/maturase [Chitinophagaceae bacterium]|nr:group II intron reverse transcriptase/maturase [Chitinophagaceae bacterium]MBX3241210.1 group II intron reverse transcriptase/maturase [Chitinophagaceae bacterium]MCW5925289.1 group II intron reverse transcriptase/maturase [Chitinophagaceae bacterium]MCW5927862.1 group II intron reverse transcriptase/maturase [Chitinophagaceae bacterium]MCW5928620.1 group II intron reverse transcriptase/maturase [Chitinophagaceae bacterium]